MQRYRVSVHNDRGITLSSYATSDTAMTADDVRREAWMRWPGADRIHVDPIPEPPADGICWRCGSSVGACGGPSDPHE